MLGNIGFWLVGLMGRVASILCNVSIYIDSTGAEVPIDYVGDPLEFATGPMRINAVSPPQYIEADISFDPAVDDLCTSDINYLIDFVQFNIPFFKIYSSLNSAHFINVFYTYSGANRILRVQANDGNGVLTTQLLNEYIAGTTSNIGFDLSGAGATKLLRAYTDGVYATDGKILNWTGITFDKLIYGVAENLTGSSLAFDLYNNTSTQLGVVDFTTRLPAKTASGNIISDSVQSIEYIVKDARYYPYIGAFTPITNYYLGDSITNQYNYVDSVTTAVIAEYTNALNIRSAQNSYISTQLAPTGFPFGDFTGGLAPDLTRNSTYCIANGADIIVFYIGINDILLGNGIEAIKAVYSAVEAECITAGVKFIPCTIMSLLESNPAQATQNAEANEVSEWIRNNFTNVADINTAMGLGGVDNWVDPTLTIFGVHPTTAGEIVQADTVSPFVLSAIDSGDLNGAYLKEDRQEINGACVTIPAGEQLVIDEITEQYETKNGAYVLKDIP
jgi:hypothetical protein